MGKKRKKKTDRAKEKKRRLQPHSLPRILAIRFRLVLCGIPFFKHPRKSFIVYLAKPNDWKNGPIPFDRLNQLFGVYPLEAKPKLPYN